MKPRRGSAGKRRPSSRSNRDLRRDLAWGAGNGVALITICFIPAFVAAVMASGPERSDQLRLVAGAFGYYVTFAIAAGGLVGMKRSSVQRRGSAIAMGTVIGAVGLGALMFVPTERLTSPTLPVVASASLLGMLVGAFLGWWAWKTARQLNVRRN